MFGVSLDKFPYNLEFNEEGLIKKEHLEAFSIFSEMLVAYFLRGITQNWVSGNTTNAKNVYFVNVKGSDLQFPSKFPEGARITAVVAPSRKDPFSNDSSDPISVRVSFGSNISLVGPIFRHEDSDLIDRNFPPQFKFLPSGEYSNIVKPVLGVSKLCIDTSGNLGDYYCYLSSDGTWSSLVTPSVFALNSSNSFLSGFEGYSLGRALDILFRFFYRYRAFSASAGVRNGISAENGTFSVSIERKRSSSVGELSNKVEVSLEVSDENTVLKVSTPARVFKGRLVDLYSKIYIEESGSGKVTFFSNLGISNGNKKIVFDVDISGLIYWTSFDNNAQGNPFILLLGLVYDAVNDRFIPSLATVGTSWSYAFHYISSNTNSQPLLSSNSFKTLSASEIGNLGPETNNFIDFNPNNTGGVSYLNAVYNTFYVSYFAPHAFDPKSALPSYYVSARSLIGGGYSWSTSIFIPLGMLACKKDTGGYKIGRIYATNNNLSIEASGSKGIISFYKEGNFCVNDITSPTYVLDSIDSRIDSVDKVSYYADRTLLYDLSLFRDSVAFDKSPGSSYLGSKFVGIKDGSEKISRSLLFPKVNLYVSTSSGNVNMGYMVVSSSVPHSLSDWYEITVEVPSTIEVTFSNGWLNFVPDSAKKFRKVKIKLVPQSQQGSSELRLKVLSPFTRLFPGGSESSINKGWARYMEFTVPGNSNVEELWVDFSAFSKVSVDYSSFSEGCNIIPRETVGFYNLVVGTRHRRLILSGINYDDGYTKFVLCPTKYGWGSDTTITLLNCRIRPFDITHTRGTSVAIDNSDKLGYYLNRDNLLPFFNLEIIDSHISVYSYGFDVFDEDSPTLDWNESPGFSLPAKTVFHIGIVPGYEGSCTGDSRPRPKGSEDYVYNDKYYLFGGWCLKTLKIVRSKVVFVLSSFSFSIPVVTWSRYYRGVVYSGNLETVNQDVLSPIIVWDQGISLVVEDSFIKAFVPDICLLYFRWRDNVYSDLNSSSSIASYMFYPLAYTLTCGQSCSNYPPFFSIITASPLDSPSLARVVNNEIHFVRHSTPDDCRGGDSDVFSGFGGIMCLRNYYPYARGEFENNTVFFWDEPANSTNYNSNNRFSLPLAIFNVKFSNDGFFTVSLSGFDSQQKSVSTAKEYYKRYIQANNNINVLV